MSGDNLLTLKQAAERLGVSYSFLFRCYRRGVLPVVRLSSRCVRVRESDIVAYVNAHNIAATIIHATKDARATRDERRKAVGLLTAHDLCSEASKEA